MRQSDAEGRVANFDFSLYSFCIRVILELFELRLFEVL